jgi:hypothetical protein
MQGKLIPQAQTFSNGNRHRRTGSWFTGNF